MAVDRRSSRNADMVTGMPKLAVQPNRRMGAQMCVGSFAGYGRSKRGCAPGGAIGNGHRSEFRSPRTSIAGAIRSRSTLPSCRPPNGALAAPLPGLERVPEARPEQPAKVPNLRDLPFRRAEVAVSRRGAKRDAIFRRALAVADVAGALFALGFAHFVTGIQVDPVVLWLGHLRCRRGEQGDRPLRPRRAADRQGDAERDPALFQLATLYTLLMTMVASAQGAPFALESIAVLWGTLLVATMIGRGIARELCPRDHGARALRGPGQREAGRRDPGEARAVRDRPRRRRRISALRAVRARTTPRHRLRPLRRSSATSTG